MVMNTSRSSETIRKTPFHFENYLLHLPQHKKTFDPSFGEWFIGFTEGDGNFQVQLLDTNNDPRSQEAAVTRYRLYFTINQKDPKLLYYIREHLGFGHITSQFYINKDNIRIDYFRYSVSDQDNIDRLIVLFNGNIILNKVYSRFRQFLQARNTREGVDQIQEMPQNDQFTFEANAWFSGFIDAEGCFYIRKQTEARYSLGFRIRCLFILDQKGERWLFEKIRDEFMGSGSITLRRRSKITAQSNEATKALPKTGVPENMEASPEPRDLSETFRYTCTDLRILRGVLFPYLRRYPLRSVKSLDWVRFTRMICYMINRKTLPWEGKVLTRVLNIVKRSHASEDQADDFTDFTGNK
jgi:hypothetical protein